MRSREADARAAKKDSEKAESNGGLDQMHMMPRYW
jgi:hypothetical protein